jgi:hypothetical protein
MEETAARRAAETSFAEHKAGALFRSLDPQDVPAAISGRGSSCWIGPDANRPNGLNDG